LFSLFFLVNLVPQFQQYSATALLFLLQLGHWISVLLIVSAICTGLGGLDGRAEGKAFQSNHVDIEKSSELSALIITKSRCTRLCIGSYHSQVIERKNKDQLRIIARVNEGQKQYKRGIN